MLQRISAIYLGSFLVYFVARLLLDQPLTAAAWHAWITHPVMRIASLGVIALALWFGRYDIARRTIRRPGVTRYIAYTPAGE